MKGDINIHIMRSTSLKFDCKLTPYKRKLIVLFVSLLSITHKFFFIIIYLI